MSSTGFYRPQALANVLAARLMSYSSPDSLVLSSYRSAGEDGPAMLECLITQHGAKLSSIGITDTHRTSLIEALIKCGNPDLLDLGLRSIAYTDINWNNIITVDMLVQDWARPHLLSALVKQASGEDIFDYNHPLMFHLRKAAENYLNPKKPPDQTWLDVIADIESVRPSSRIRPLLSVLMPSYVDIRYDFARSSQQDLTVEKIDDRFLAILHSLPDLGVELDRQYPVEKINKTKFKSKWYENSLHEALEKAALNHYWLPCVDQLISFMPWEPVLQADLSPAARQLLLAQPLVCRTLLTQVSQQVNPSPDFAKVKPKM